MKLLNLGSAIDLTTVANGDWVDCDETPFLEGWDAILHASYAAASGTAKSFKVQGTNDGGTTVVDVLAVTSAVANSLTAVTCYKQMRWSVVTAFSAGTANVDLIGGP